MKMSAATQLRSGTRRGTPPRGRGGGGGSSGWMRCHSALGRSRSTRLVMAGSIPAPVSITQTAHRRFRNVHLRRPATPPDSDRQVKERGGVAVMQDDPRYPFFCGPSTTAAEFGNVRAA
jgi:hypothetical protein